MRWTYAIKGIAEAPVDTTQHNLVVKTREVLDTFYALTLTGFEGARENMGVKDLLKCELEVG
jgi:hypothetical protein